MNYLRVLIGLAFWCGLLVALWTSLGNRGNTAQANANHCFSDLWGYYTSSRRLELRLPASCELSRGDPVFAANQEGSLQQIGVVEDLSVASDPEGFKTARAVLFSSAPEPTLPVKAYYVGTPDTIEWVVQTLLPPQRREQIERELAAALQEHQHEILKALQPVVNKSVREALAFLEQDLPVVIEKHRPELKALAGNERAEVLKRELIALAKTEIWPIVRQDSESLVREMGGELWERLSLWRFAWRGMVDHLPLLRGNHRLEEELRRFLEEEATPIFARHEEQFLVLIEQVLRDVADNNNVRAVFKKSITKVVEDPELQRILGDILHEAVVQNPRFWQTVKQNLSGAEAQDALRLTATRLEPTVRRIGDLVLGTREDGLTPEFTRVLRQQILLKDRHGIIIGDVPSAGPSLSSTPLDVRLFGTAR